MMPGLHDDPSRVTISDILMELSYDPSASFAHQFSCRPSNPAREAAIDAIHNWKSVSQLVDFAEARHGYQNTDGFFGIFYPSDLNEFDRANGDPIPNGMIQANAWYGAHDGPIHLLPELEYLELLRQYLTLLGKLELACRISRLIAPSAI